MLVCVPDSCLHVTIWSSIQCTLGNLQRQTCLDRINLPLGLLTLDSGCPILTKIEPETLK